ncbi:hypothetical protein EJ04DRAFT_546284 [Polyplosphaeria fusca]|uniref:RING-type domain-containing protein n=1 Tax=Polyplosphaeria fusca TaxID=682080 RepID=A0A9P4QQ80_9PLEO|nr:hypothetical protein EJ04DRAFT_546284 [Polyplosphaeria fusca]
MEHLLTRLLNPTTACPICQLSFDEQQHAPVALACRHIFGNNCLKEWLQGGHGNIDCCPVCRDRLLADDRPEELPNFSPGEIWKGLREQSDIRLNNFMSSVWRGLQGDTVLDILNDAIIPALMSAGTLREDTSINPFTQCHLLLHALYHGTGVNTAHSLAVPLIRLARLMEHAFPLLPPHLNNRRETNMLLWNANACIPLAEDNIRWSFLSEASTLTNDGYFPLLQLYTVLMSQNIAHHLNASHWPKRKEDKVSMVMERCCRIIGNTWVDAPDAEFKGRLVAVYEELRRHQQEFGRVSLRGKEGEENIVRGLWQMAGWQVRRDMER